jgi:hypothetical protein
MNQSGTVIYEKPKILLVDCDKGIEQLLKAEGFNVHSGSFGTPYRIEKSDRYVPVIVSYLLPNYTEQEIVIVDLQSREPVAEPIGEKHLPDGEMDWWVKCNRDLVDPAPRAMAAVQDAFYRVLENGGLFVVFANKKIEQDLVFARLSQNLGLRDPKTLTFDNWSFLPLFFQLNIVEDHGSEIHPIDQHSSLGQLLAGSLEGCTFTCTLTPRYDLGHLWKILATNKYGEPVSVAFSRPDNLGMILVLPQLSLKGQFLAKLLKDVLPELSPHLFPEIAEGKWVHRAEYELSEVLELNAQKDGVAERAAREISALSEGVDQVRNELGWMHELLTGQDKRLVEAVKKALAILGFEKVIDVDEERDQHGQSRREDLQIQDTLPTLIVDVRGIGGLPADADVLQADKHATIRMREWERTNILPLSIVNHQRHLPPLERENKTPFRKELLDHSEESRLGMITTWDLFRLVRSFQKNNWAAKDVKPLFYRSGRIGIIPAHYKYLGRVAQVWTHAFSVIVDEEELCTGDRIAFEVPLGSEETLVTSLQLDNSDVGRAAVGSEIGIRTTPEPPKLKEGMRVFRVRQKQRGETAASAQTERVL